MVWKKALFSSALSDDMLKHDIAIKKAVDMITDSAKQDKSKKTEENEKTIVFNISIANKGPK